MASSSAQPTLDFLPARVVATPDDRLLVALDYLIATESFDEALARRDGALRRLPSGEADPGRDAEASVAFERTMQEEARRSLNATAGDFRRLVGEALRFADAIGGPTPLERYKSARTFLLRKGARP